MNKTVIAIVAVALIGGGAYLWLYQPEPTPAERLEDAAAEARDALQEAGSAISDGVQQSGTELVEDAQEAATALAEMAADKTEELSAEAVQLIAAWQATGIVTEDGINMENAIKAVEDSGLDGETKDKIITLLKDIREAPDQIDDKMKEIGALLKTSP